MTFTCRRFSAALLFPIGLLVLALGPSCPAATGSTDAVPYGQRTDAFRRVLFEFRFQPLHTFADLQANPSESLLIVLGDPHCLSKSTFPQGLRSFVQRGGAVLIATDRETKGEASELLGQLAGVAVTGETLICVNPDPKGLYDGSPYCPFVEPLEDTIGPRGSTNILGIVAALVGAGSRPALFRNPLPDKPDLRVATNAPSRLLKKSWLLPGGIHRLAQLSNGCLDETLRHYSLKKIILNIDKTIESEDASADEKITRQLSGERPLFAVGGTVGKGRVLVLADHSVFINRMLLPRDNGNLEFTANCLHWLRGGVSTPTEALRVLNGPQALEQLTGQRNKVLFWDDGVIRTDLEVPLTRVPLEPSLPPEPVIVAALDKTIANLEDNDYFNRKLLENMDDVSGGHQRLLRYVVYLLTLAASLLVSYRFLWRGRYRPESAVLSLTDALGPHRSKLSWMEQRRRAQLRSGNVWETAHRLARECFESANISLSAPAPPRMVMTHGGWRRRWRLRRRLVRLWHLAHGNAPFVISPKALQRRVRELEELKIALADGTLTVV